MHPCIKQKNSQIIKIIRSCIHDHGGSQGWVRVMQGNLHEYMYEVDSHMDMPTLEPTSVGVLGAGQATYIDDGIGIHKLANESDNQVATLHVYAPPYTKCGYFNQKTGKRLVGEVHLTSAYGEKLPATEDLTKACGVSK